MHVTLSVRVLGYGDKEPIRNYPILGGDMAEMRQLLGDRTRRYRSFYLMFVPVALYLLIFTYYPLLKGILLSFQENRLIGHRAFVGVRNYADVVSDSNFRSSVVNSLVIGLFDMVLYFVLSLVLALVLNELKIGRVRRSVQTIAYIPYLLSWTVIGGIWTIIFDIRGIANVVLNFFGHQSVFFLAEPLLSRPLIIAMGVWRSVGYFALLFYVSISGIDEGLFEAARIDGASRMMQIRKIILPSLRGTMNTVFVLLSIGVLTHFDEIYVMVNPANRGRIGTLLLYVYENGIVNFRMGLASAGAILVMIGTIIISGVSRSLSKYDLE